MSQQKQKPPDGDPEGHLKQELRNLPRVTAPWHLESEVLRRIRRTEPSRTWTMRPVPAIAGSLLGVVLLSGIGYMVYTTILSEPVTTPAKEVQPTPANSVPTPSPKLEPAIEEKLPASHPEGSSVEKEVVAGPPVEVTRTSRPPASPDAQSIRPPQGTVAVPDSSPAQQVTIRPGKVDSMPLPDSVRIPDIISRPVDSARVKSKLIRPSAPVDTIH